MHFLCHFIDVTCEFVCTILKWRLEVFVLLLYTTKASCRVCLLMIFHFQPRQFHVRCGVRLLKCIFLSLTLTRCRLRCTFAEHGNRHMSCTDRLHTILESG